MNFNVTELDLLLDAVKFRLRTLETWQRDLMETNEKMNLLDGLDDVKQENLDIIREYQVNIDRLQPLHDKLSEMLYATIK